MNCTRTALRDGVSPHSLQVENGSFEDSSRRPQSLFKEFKLLGLRSSFENKIPALQSTYSGAFDEQTVLSKGGSTVSRWQKSLQKIQPIMQRRVELALGSNSPKI